MKGTKCTSSKGKKERKKKDKNYYPNQIMNKNNMTHTREQTNKDVKMFNITEAERLVAGVLFHKPWYVKYFSFHSQDFSSWEYRKIYEIAAENEGYEVSEMAAACISAKVSILTVMSFYTDPEIFITWPPADFVAMCESLRDKMLGRELKKKIEEGLTISNAIEYANELASLRSSYDLESFSKMLASYYDTYLEKQEKIRKGTPYFINTGMTMFDNNVHIERGEMVILGARTSIGKTMFALWIAVSAAKRGQKVIFVNLEMSKEQVMNRIMAMLTGEAISDYKYCNVDIDSVIPKVENVMRNLEILTAGNVKSTHIRKVLMSRPGVDLLVVDYINLFTDKADSVQIKLSNIANNLKSYSIEKKCAILALCQLNRDSEKEKREPELSDIKDSSGIEQAADTVILLHKPDRESSEMTAFIRKQRNGMRGRVDYIFDDNRTMYIEQRPIYN